MDSRREALVGRIARRGSAGRPVIPAHLRRDATLRVRVTRSELAAAHAVARRRGVTLSDYVRRLLDLPA